VTDVEILPETTMGDILQRIPASQRALFQRYHIGGCSSCGYEPGDTLAKVCKDHNILDVNEVITFLHEAHELDQKIQLAPAEVKSWLDAGKDFSFIDVRSGEELESGEFPEAELMDYDDSEKYMALPKDRTIVFACLEGDRALNVAAYFRGHEFTEVYCLRGGIQAWRRELDAGIAS
jgi:rhodanese-related sulfurtransferase